MHKYSLDAGVRHRTCSGHGCLNNHQTETETCNTHPCTAAITDDDGDDEDTGLTIWMIGLIAGVGVGLLFLGAILCACLSGKKSKKTSREESQSQREGRNEPPNVFVLQVRGEEASATSDRLHDRHESPPPYRYREDSWMDSKIY